jgi:hypothetical protein
MGTKVTIYGKSLYLCGEILSCEALRKPNGALAVSGMWEMTWTLAASAPLFKKY